MTSIPEPVDLRRLSAHLRAKGREYITFTEEIIQVEHDSASFYFSIENPQVMQISAQWKGIANSAEDFQILCSLVGECNSSFAFPKAFMVPLSPPGRYTIGAECSILTTRGLSTGQFNGFAERSVTALSAFFQRVEQSIPWLVTWKVAS